MDSGSSARMGRLSQPPHPLLFELFYRPQLERDQREVLPYLLRIDAAHVVMLAQERILPHSTAARLLDVNREMGRRLQSGEPVLPAPSSHRGLFWLYEQQYIARLGEEIGGAAHVARSRNDINAAVNRLRVRDETLALLAAGCDLLDALAAAARTHVTTLMSCFTHLQPAQPSTLGHYLAGVLGEALRSLEWLLRALDAADASPLGAAAGAGTSLPIRPETVARLLGFRGVIGNSVDAVASRDYVVQVLSGAAMAGSTLTRLALDLQAWGSAAYGFVDWPDQLVSTSSIMPQKRNAFVLEEVRGKAVQAAGALVNALVGFKNVPYANAIEVSSEGSAQAWPALQATGDALRLMTLLITEIQVRPERMRAFLAGAQTTMTAVADHLVARHGLSFRTAHDLVGAMVGRLAAEPEAVMTPERVRQELESAIAARGLPAVELDLSDLAAVLDPESAMRAAAYGGGPAPSAVEAQLEALAARIHELRAGLGAWHRRLGEAEDALAHAVREICEGEVDGP